MHVNLYTNVCWHSCKHHTHTYGERNTTGKDINPMCWDVQVYKKVIWRLFTYNAIIWKNPLTGNTCINYGRAHVWHAQLLQRKEHPYLLSWETCRMYPEVRSEGRNQAVGNRSCDVICLNKAGGWRESSAVKSACCSCSLEFSSWNPPGAAHNHLQR